MKKIGLFVFLISIFVFSCNKESSSTSHCKETDNTCNIAFTSYSINDGLKLPATFNGGSITDIAALPNGQVFVIATPTAPSSDSKSAVCKFENGVFNVVFESKNPLQLTNIKDDVFISQGVQFDSDILMKWNSAASKMDEIQISGFEAKQLISVQEKKLIYAISGKNIFRIDPYHQTNVMFLMPNLNNFNTDNNLYSWEQNNIDLSVNGSKMYVTGSLGLYEWDFTTTAPPKLQSYQGLNLGQFIKLNKVLVDKNGRVLLFGSDFSKVFEYNPETQKFTDLEFFSNHLFSDRDGKIWSFSSFDFKDDLYKSNINFSVSGCEMYRKWINTYSDEEVFAFSSDNKSIWIGLKGSLSQNEVALVRVCIP